MRTRRLFGPGLAAMALTAILAGSAQADSLPETVSATGSPNGVTVICPEGLHPGNNWTITNGDGTPLRVRWDYMDTEGERGIIAWVGSWHNGPPLPPSITLTVACTC
jgi:hypothetical protein